MGRAEHVIDELFDKNYAWARRKTEEDPTFFRRLAEQQAPRFMWVGCSDSRVPANDVVGLDPGEVFVHRNIANVIHTSDMNMLAVLEFAVEVLNVRHIVICGHYGCGGVRRAIENATGLHRDDMGCGLVDHWLAPIVDVYNRHRAEIDRTLSTPHERLCELNVALQMRRLAATPVLKRAWKHGAAITVHGWIYGLGDGLLRDLGTTISSFAELAALPPFDDVIGATVEPMCARRLHAMAAFQALADDVSLEPCGCGIGAHVPACSGPD